MRFIENAHWIWSAENDISPDLYRNFYKNFSYVPNTEKVFLEISVCSTFAVRINDTLLPGQQLSDFPDSPTSTVYDITKMLSAGENRLTVQVHYIGTDFLTCLTGKPFLKLAVSRGESILAESDSSWQWSEDAHYHSNLACKINAQLGFVYEYRADSAENKRKPVFIADDLFQGISVSERKVPLLNELPMPSAELVQMGLFKRCDGEGTFADKCMTDAFIPGTLAEMYDVSAAELSSLYYHRNYTFSFPNAKPFRIKGTSSFPDCDGIYLTVDLGCEQAGYFVLKMTAPAGTIVDICHGEHLAEGRVASKIEQRNFTDRYICCEGKNEFIYRHRRIGCRYIELHILSRSGITLEYCGMIPLELPLPPQTSFESEDRILVKNRELAIRTLHLCMHEHYEDCPWREQALYGYDSRNQMMYGYYAWGNYDFAAASIDLLGKSFDGKRYFTLTAPGKLGNRTIPVFTLVWITELYEYQLFSGDGSLFAKWSRTADQILDTALSCKVPGHPEFYHPGTEDGIWNFCEWNHRLSNVEEHPSSTYNVYLYEALCSAAKLHRYAGNPLRADALQQTADALGKALQNTFWNPVKKIYTLTCTDAPDEYEHVQAIFMANGLAGEHAEDLTKVFSGHRLHAISFSGLLYLIRALQNTNAEGRKFLYDYLDHLFTPMLLSGATSLWEIAGGYTGFNHAGSLCHGWSSVMTCYCGSMLLGISPLEPGFTKFLFKPYCGNLTHVSGDVATPHGMIHVEWQLSDGKINAVLTCPQGCTPVIASFDECPVGNVKLQMM